MRKISKVFSPKRRRALSTVVTTAMMLSAMSVTGLMTVGWANTSLATKQFEMQTSLNTQMNKLHEEIVLENIWFGTSPNIANITLGNAGSIGLNITSIEIINSTSTLYFTITNGGIESVVGDDYSFQTPFNWDAGETTTFQIITERGNIFTAQEVT